MGTTYATQAALPHTLTLLPTYQCTAECADCCFHSSPRIKKRIPQDRLLRYVDEAAQFPGMLLVVISGGEPFLLRHDLVELIQRITDRGLLSRIVSNAYWAVNDDGALATIRPLVEAGLREISFSTGDDHVQFVPLERVLAAINACLYVGIGVSLMIEEREGGVINRRAVVEAASRYPEVLKAIENRVVTLLESPWMKFSDDPSEPTWRRIRMARTETLATRHHCSSVLASIVVTPDEKLGMCCGLPREDIADLNVGDLRAESMLSLYARHVHDILKIWLSVEGPERILAWAATKDPRIEWENKYAHSCDACRAVYGDPRVMEAIHRYGDEKVDDLMTILAAYTIPFTGGDDRDRSHAAEWLPPPVQEDPAATVALLRRGRDGSVTSVALPS